MSKLLDVIIRSGNVSGAIRVAPHSLAGLKDALRAVPFDVIAPSMSVVASVENLSAGIAALSRLPGLDLGALGQLQPLLGQLSVIARGGVATLTADVIRQALGPGVALGVALTSYGSALDGLRDRFTK